jgi:hypothetical protein
VGSDDKNAQLPISTPHYGSNNPTPSLRQQGKRVFVTKFSMAHWYAQTFNFSVHDIPRTNPNPREGNDQIGYTGFTNTEWTAIKGKMGKFYYGKEPEQLVHRRFHEKDPASTSVKQVTDKDWMKDP